MTDRQPEEFLGQIKIDNAWVDYARGYEEVSKTWQSHDPGGRRLVHWISREVLVPAECEAYNARRQGVCGAPLTALDDCPNALDHGEA